MHWFKCSSEMRQQEYIFYLNLFHWHIRRLEHVAPHPPARAWQRNVRDSAAPWAACRGNCVHQREGKEAGVRRVEWLCRMQSWGLPEKMTAAWGQQPRLQDGGRASAAAARKNLQAQIHCASVASTTRSREFAWREKADTADVSAQTRVFTDNKAVARKEPQLNTL